jgi:O-antigen/teichoic acid export membrane protein
MQRPQLNDLEASFPAVVQADEIFSSARFSPLLRRIKHPLAIASFTSFVIYVLGAIVSYCTQLVIARSIGIESFGIYAYAMAWVTMLGFVATLGFYTSILRFIPTYLAQQQWALARGVIRFSQASALLASLLVITLVTAIFLVTKVEANREQALTYMVGAVVVPFTSLHLINAAIVRSFGGNAAAVAPERLLRDTVILTIVGVLAWTGLARADATLAMSATLVAAMATLVVLKYFQHRMKPPMLANESATYAAREWCKPVLPLIVSVISDNLLNRIGIILLGWHGQTRFAGVFAIALGMSLLAAIPRIAVSTTFAPQVSELRALGDDVGLQHLFARAAGMSFLGSLSVAIPMLLLSSELLGLFGNDFSGGELIVAILMVGQVVSAMCGPQQQVMNMCGYERSSAVIFTFCVALNVIACLLTVKTHGMLGAALAMTSTLIIWNAAIALFIYKKLGILPGVLYIFTMRRRLWS